MRDPVKIFLLFLSITLGYVQAPRKLMNTWGNGVAGSWSPLRCIRGLAFGTTCWSFAGRPTSSGYPTLNLHHR